MKTKSEDRKQHILKIADEIFSQKGYHRPRFALTLFGMALIVFARIAKPLEYVHTIDIYQSRVTIKISNLVSNTLFVKYLGDGHHHKYPQSTHNNRSPVPTFRIYFLLPIHSSQRAPTVLAVSTPLPFSSIPTFFSILSSLFIFSCSPRLRHMIHQHMKLII